MQGKTLETVREEGREYRREQVSQPMEGKGRERRRKEEKGEGKERRKERYTEHFRRPYKDEEPNQTNTHTWKTDRHILRSLVRGDITPLASF